MPLPPDSTTTRAGRALLAALTAAALFAAGACSGSGGGESRVGKGEEEVTSTTRAPIIPPESYDSLRNATDPNSFLNAFGAVGSSLQSVPPEALAGAAVAPIALDFLSLVTDVQATDYSVAYRISGEAVGSLPGETYLTIVHTPQAQKIAVRSGSIEAAEFRSGGETVSCAKAVQWDCQPPVPANGAPVGAEVLLFFLGLVVEQPGAFDTSTYRTEIVGVPVNCIRSEPGVTSVELGVIEVCVTAEGVPLRGVLPQLTLDGVWYVPGADPADVVPPA